MSHTNNKGLVTGGAGFIGSELVRQLLRENEEVIVYDNFSFGRRSNLPNDSNLHVVNGDIRDLDKLEATFKVFSPTKVFHLAALHFIPYCINNPQETIRVNVEGTLNVLETCKNGSVNSVVYASTAAVYPVSQTAHSENDVPGPMEIYGASKLFGEQFLKLFHNETGIKCAVARLFNGYGRRETNPHVIPDILDQLPNRNEIALGNIEPKRDFIHTSDISSALRMMADNNSFNYEIFNVGTGKQTSVEGIVNIIANILRRPLRINTEAIRKRKVERMHLVSDITKIKNRLGWHPRISLEDGFRDMLNAVDLR